MSLDIVDLFSVKDKHIVVTGGGRGIGRMISEGYVRNGAIVYIASRDVTACDKTATELTSIGPGKCFSLPGDLSSVDGCKALVEKLKNQYQLNKLHVLVNNSGASWGEALEKFPESGWDKIMNLNVKSPFFLTQAMLPLLKAAGTKEDPARVINIGSITGESIQFAPTYSYDVSKAAVHHLTRKLARDLAPHHITVNAIAPGFVPTKMGSQLLTYNGEEKMIAVIPMGRSGRTSDMAGVALYLSSPSGSWTTGIVIPVDGGALVYRPSKL